MREGISIKYRNAQPMHLIYNNTTKAARPHTARVSLHKQRGTATAIRFNVVIHSIHWPLAKAARRLDGIVADFTQWVG